MIKWIRNGFIFKSWIKPLFFSNMQTCFRLNELPLQTIQKKLIYGRFFPRSWDLATLWQTFGHKHSKLIESYTYTLSLSLSPKWVLHFFRYKVQEVPAKKRRNPHHLNLILSICISLQSSNCTTRTLFHLSWGDPERKGKKHILTGLHSQISNGWKQTYVLKVLSVPQDPYFH